MDSAWKFYITLTSDFGSSGASLMTYTEWKLPKIGDSPPWATCSMSQTSTSERRLSVPIDLGISWELPQGINGLGGRPCSPMLTDFQDF